MLLYLWLLILLYFSNAFNIDIAECGGLPSKCAIEYFADAMQNRTFIAENYGEEYEERFESYSRDYYRPELNNSNILIETMLNLNDPNNSPGTKMEKNIECYNDFVSKDLDNTNVNNLTKWASNGGKHLKDNILFSSLDNTNVSKSNPFWNQNN